MKKLLLFICFLLAGIFVMAKETPVTPGTFNAAYATAVDGDVLLLETGTYGSSIDFPSGKSITIRAAQGASPIFTGSVGGATVNGGSLIFDGVELNRGADYLISADFTGDITSLEFRNLTIRNVGRCLIRTNGTGVIDSIVFDNCIIKDCGNNGWNLIYPKHAVKRLSTKNSTLYNYLNGEGFLYVNGASTSNIFEFIFENNTVYKWGSRADRSFCNVGSNYSSGSTYIYRNNIVVDPGKPGEVIPLLKISSGDVIAENNLVVNYGGYSGGTQTISDLTLEGLGMQSVSFPDPDNGDFSILATSPLATAGKNGVNIGDPRWVKVISNPVNLLTIVYPLNAGTSVPTAASYELGDSATVAATRNYGYEFKEWQKNGVRISTDNPYTFEITADTELTAVFEAIETYALTVNKEGDGAEWGKISLNPEPINGVYEKNTLVSVTIIPNDVTSFLYWEDLSNEISRQVLMDGSKNITTTFDWIPFIVGWNFDPTEPRGNRTGDFYSRTNNTGVMKFFKGDGSTTNWGSNSRDFGGVTYACARRYTDFVDMGNPRYFQAEFSAQEYENIKYTNIQIKSFIGVDNECVHKIQKMQYATAEAGPYIDLVTIDLSTSDRTKWIECNAMLPNSLTEAEKEKIYIRWVADPTSSLLGSPALNASEGFYLANVFVFTSIDEGPDTVAPVLLSSVPAEASSTASANGSIVLTFNERVKAGDNGGIVEFNGENLVPIFGSKTVIYPYTKLSYSTQYTFTLPVGAIVDMSDNQFAGVSINFSTMERRPPIPRLFDAIVDINGVGDYTTIQAAIDAVPVNRTSPWLIFVKKGKYEEIVRVPSNKPYIHLIGQDKEEVVITYKINCSEQGQDGYEHSKEQLGLYDCSVVVVDASNFYAENISFENSWGVEDKKGPMALALRTNGDRFSFNNCKFRSYQDTWQTSSKSVTDRLYVYNSWIEGAVDYFYGGGNAFVDECTLYNVRPGSVIVAPSHADGTEWGYVFNSCTIDGNSSANDGNLKLGRPWKNKPTAVYINTTMKILPHPEGWTDMGPAAKLFAEYNSMDINGNPIDLSYRRTWYRQSAGEGGQTITGLKAVLTQEEAARYTYENVLGGSDSWNPKAYFESVDKPQDFKGDWSAKISWTASAYAICYIIYRDSNLIAFTTETSYADTSAVKENTYIYQVQPVNEYGSLGLISDKVIVKVTDDDSEDPDPNPETSIELEKKSKPFAVQLGDELIIKNVVPNDEVTLYNIFGRIVYQKKSGSDILSIPVKGLKGFYFVKIGVEHTLKVAL